MSEQGGETIHLWTGLLVCGKPESWCGAEFVIEYEEGDDGPVRKVKNGTENKERATCSECIAKCEEAVRSYYEDDEKR